MTRKEYMQHLSDALSPLPEKAREAALNFCEEMLDDRMEDGMDEEAAVAAMESPKTIADRLISEAGDSIDTGKLRLPNRDEYLQFARLADEALEGVDKALRDADAAEDAKKEAAEKTAQEAKKEAQEPPKAQADPDAFDVGQLVRDAMEAARHGIKMGQQAMESARQQANQAKKSVQYNGDYEQRILTCPADILTAVCMTCSNLPVVISPCPGDTATLTYYTSASDPYDARVENGVMILERRGSGKSGFVFNMVGSGFKILLRGSFPTVELALPPQSLVDLTVRTANGSIKVGGFSALCAVNAQTSNSRIEIKDVTCKSMELKSSNGRLVMENMTVKKGVSAVTSNSRIEGRGVRGGGDVILKTSNGAIEMQRVAGTGALSAITSNGHIRAEDITGAALTLKTANGSIRGILPGRQGDYAIDSGTSNGKNTLPRQQPGARPLYAHTSNGNIDVKFEG